jgi:LacI family transcriptional regulator
VSEETRQRVMNIVKQYNYTNSNKVGNTLKNICFLKHKKHGMLVEQNEGFISAILDTIEAECRLEGYNLTMIVCDNNFENTCKIYDWEKY